MQPGLLHNRIMTRTLALVAAAGLVLAAAPALAQSIEIWTQYTAQGVEVRGILPDGQASCPSLTVDGKPVPMLLRAAASANFPRTLCGLTLPAGVKSVAAGGHAVPVPVADPQRILVLGDTGCRIKGTSLQACNDPAQWPFAGLAKAAAAEKPDLIIHLGDYLYRESPCPTTFPGCAGSPWGDNWAAWDADFFTPAQPLFDAAPMLLVRGNHEDCNRAGPGFLRLLGPGSFDPAAPCNAHLDPYAVPFGSETVAMIDSASAADVPLDESSVPAYQKDFDALKAMGQELAPGHELWFATHRPLWGAISYMGAPAGGNATMIKAAGDLSAFQAVSLMLAGHIHAFEAINYEAKIPPQIVAGHGGDNLDSTPANLRGTTFQGNSGVLVKDGFSVPGFGYLMMLREKGNAGWTVQLYDSAGHPEQKCVFENRALFCLMKTMKVH
jgi:calcineurin-like phosphoesterase family protein